MSKFLFLDNIILNLIAWPRRTLRYQDLNIQGPAVIACWHDELLPIAYNFRHTKTIALVSGKRAGRTLARDMVSMGHQVVYGSSTRGGLKAVKNIIDMLNDELVLITCDGPSGPRHKMKAGALFIAEKADVPLFFLRPEYKGWRINKSWDKLLVPFPFAKVTFHLEQFDYKKPYPSKEARLLDAEKKLSHLLPDAAS